MTPWHLHHITERYGLFTLILLGESLLASSNAIIEALHNGATLWPLISISILTLVVTASLWWIYFRPPHHRAIGSFGRSLRYGYVHYFVFAAAGTLRLASRSRSTSSPGTANSATSPPPSPSLCQSRSSSSALGGSPCATCRPRRQHGRTDRRRSRAPRPDHPRPVHAHSRDHGASGRRLGAWTTAAAAGRRHQPSESARPQRTVVSPRMLASGRFNSDCPAPGS
jgi:Bacterial low temperature requirement A protein (LtrA)